MSADRPSRWNIRLDLLLSIYVLIIVFFFCFREPCDPVPSFILFIVSTQVNTLLKTHSNSFLRKMCFLPHFTNKQIIRYLLSKQQMK